MRRYMHGVADYDWTKVSVDPPLTDAEKKTIADLVDSFKTKEEVQKWVNDSTAAYANDAAKQAAFWRLGGPVLILTEQKKITDLNALFKPTFSTPETTTTTETPWLLYAAGAAVLFLLLKK